MSDLMRLRSLSCDCREQRVLKQCYIMLYTLLNSVVALRRALRISLKILCRKILFKLLCDKKIHDALKTTYIHNFNRCGNNL